MPVLCVFLTEAERMGYRRKERERFLADTETGHHGTTRTAHESERPLQVAAVRLLPLTRRRRRVPRSPPATASLVA